MICFHYGGTQQKDDKHTEGMLTNIFCALQMLHVEERLLLLTIQTHMFEMQRTITSNDNTNNISHRNHKCILYVYMRACVACAYVFCAFWDDNNNCIKRMRGHTIILVQHRCPSNIIIQIRPIAILPTDKQ